MHTRTTRTNRENHNAPSSGAPTGVVELLMVFSYGLLATQYAAAEDPDIRPSRSGFVRAAHCAAIEQFVTRHRDAVARTDDSSRYSSDYEFARLLRARTVM